MYGCTEIPYFPLVFTAIIYLRLFCNYMIYN